MVQNIEDVDLLGQAMDLAQLIQERGLSAQIDYVISAHSLSTYPTLFGLSKLASRF